MNNDNLVHKPKVLYVDDEQENLFGFRLLFKRFYTIFLAESADKGLEVLCNNEGIDVVISDQRMPGKTGIEFFEDIANLYPYSTRIILTGYSDLQSVISAINKGRVYHYISKPWSDEQLKIIIDNAVEVSRLKRQNDSLIDDLSTKNADLKLALLRLQDSEQELELKVKERTNELQQVNEELRSVNEELNSINERLIDEVAVRKKTEDELNEYKEHLENLVEQRTSEVIRKNNLIEESERKLSLIYNSTNESIALFTILGDDNYRVESYNFKYKDTLVDLGLDPRIDLMGMNINDVFSRINMSEELNLFFISHFNAAVSAKKNIRFESVKNTPQGKKYFAENQLIPIFNEFNRCIRLLYVSRDITNRKNTEEALRHETLINSTLADISRAIIVPDLNIANIITIVREAALLLTDSSLSIVCTANTAAGESDIHLFHPESNTIVDVHLNYGEKGYGLWEGLLDQVCSFVNNEPLVRDSLEGLIPTDRFEINHYVSVPAFFGDMLVGQLVVANAKSKYTNKDLSVLERIADIYALAIVRRRMEDELIKAKDKAEESDRLKSAFLANMSHEIRTPMNGILGFSNLLNDETLTPDAKKAYISIINSSANQLLTIINDIVDISKIEAGQLKIFKKESNITSLLESLFLQFEREISLHPTKSNLRISLLKDSNYPSVSFTTDEVRLRQVLTNLLNNAIKFTESGSIELGYHCQEQGVLLFYVKDTGIGIVPEKQEVIFERFVQADNALTKQFGGTGLGLAISKGLVELLGGTIWVRSETGLGSTFYVEFPAPDLALVQNVSLLAQQPFYKPSYSFAGRTILIVEDTLHVFQYLVEILSPTKANILYADCAQEAMDLCRNNYMDIILMDLQLPDMTGYELVKKVKAIKPNVPVIAQTSFALEGDEQTVLTSGFDGYITKPINEDLLTEKLNSFFTRSYAGK